MSVIFAVCVYFCSWAKARFGDSSDNILRAYVRRGGGGSIFFSIVVTSRAR